MAPQVKDGLWQGVKGSLAVRGLLFESRHVHARPALVFRAWDLWYDDVIGVVHDLTMYVKIPVSVL